MNKLAQVCEANLKKLLGDVFRSRTQGARYDRLARANGYADGYMRALLDANILSESELLHVVSETRRDFHRKAA